MIKEIMADAHQRMEKTIDALHHELMSIRTGRASPALVEHFTIDYYGTPTPLMQIATIAVPEAQQIVIRPYSRGDIGAIEKAIAKSDLKLTPNNDGQQVRLMIPALNEERRRELTKLVNKRGEESRVAIRNIRRDAIQLCAIWKKNTRSPKTTSNGARKKSRSRRTTTSNRWTQSSRKKMPKL